MDALKRVWVSKFCLGAMIFISLMFETCPSLCGTNTCEQGITFQSSKGFGLASCCASNAPNLLGVPKFDSVSAAVRNELHWLPIEKRIRFKIALLVRHCIVGAAPEYLTELCHPVSSSSGRQCLRFASRVDLILPRFRLRRSGYRDFAVSGPHVWNSLPNEIRQSCNNLFQFKSKLKTFLFQQS